ncbi:hypothetical protein K431DRAFT_300300 [Polychaeton citri CBS 116435]|uniref:F-box domain-containing protein n=1 Tax=Polychaeton citri CBS 116435 TaxID=1314669 RepID=A0A9P4QFW7_9PEZI|nr:hypothetical protein K431DRAFT_300300 [Polychaeton citri CBS 116435]
MVFQHSGRRRRTARVSRSFDVKRLPDEIILNILEELPTPDLWAVRLTHPRLAPSASTLIQDRLKRLYVHPSITNLRRVIKFCDHPFFRQEVVEVVMLTKAPISSTTSSLEKQAGGCTALYKPWNGCRQGSDGKIHEMQKFYNSDGREFYRPLIDALRNLPKFYKLSFNSKCREPGFCAVFDSKVESHSLKSLQKPEDTDPTPTLTQYFKDYRTSSRRMSPDSRTDIFILLSVLSIIRPGGNNIEELSLGLELPHSQTPFFEAAALNESAQFTHIMSLTLAINRGWEKQAWHLFCRNAISKCQSLQRLRIEYQPNRATAKLQLERSTKTLLEMVPSTLTRLELAALKLDVCSGRAHQASQRSFHLIRLDFDLLGFLRKRPQITHLTLDDIVLPASDYERLITVMRESKSMSGNVILSRKTVGIALLGLYEEVAERLQAKNDQGVWEFVCK